MLRPISTSSRNRSLLRCQVVITQRHDGLDDLPLMSMTEYKPSAEITRMMLLTERSVHAPSR